MLTSFGWSTVGAEQSDPDTLNHLLFGSADMSNSFGDMMFDQHDDYSSFGVSGASKEEESVITGTEWGTSASHDTEVFLPGIGMPSCIECVDEPSPVLPSPAGPLEGNSLNFQALVFPFLRLFPEIRVPINFSNRACLFRI